MVHQLIAPLAPLARQIRAAKWKLSHRDHLAVFNWHQVTPHFDQDRNHRFTWTSSDYFEKALNYVKHGFDVVPLGDAIDRLKEGKLRGACASLTFDDGDSSVPDHVVPALERHNLPATFFLNTAYLTGVQTYWFPVLSFLTDNDDLRRAAGVSDTLISDAQELRTTQDPAFYQRTRTRIEDLAYLLPATPVRSITEEWIRSLNNAQFEIACHGHEHQRYSMMPASWQERDLARNRKILGDFDAFSPIFAVPFGRRSDWTDETIRISRGQGLEVALADGGINVAVGTAIQRMPSDSQDIEKLIHLSMRS